jgi:thiosulfate/3-mercaptopyruvate sulfurtransferase
LQAANYDGVEMISYTKLFCTIIIIVFLLNACQITDNTDNKYDSMLVTPDWLNVHLNDPDLVIFYVGQKALYDSIHIPGAQFIKTSELSLPREEGKLALELPEISKIDTVLEKYGVSNNSRIVLYFGKDWISPTTRIYFILDYAGLGENTSILDGGLQAWQRSGYPLTSETEQRAKGKLDLKADPNKITDFENVSSNLNSKQIKIVDARDERYFSGKDNAFGRIKRPGHIPGAVNLPYYSVVNNSLLTFESIEKIDSLFNSNGITRDKEVFPYCHIGQQATVIYFAAKYLGYKVKLYDGSYEDWENHVDAKVEKPETD